MKKETKWKTAPISPACEVITRHEQVIKYGKCTNHVPIFCGRPTRYAYPAWGGGWMALCGTHGHKHRNSSGTQKISDLIAGGETFA